MDTEQPLDGRDPRIAAAREAATTTVEDVVHTDTSCLSLMDDATRARVWEDVLYDGHGHSHGAGGMMLNEAALSTHLDHDGNFPVRLFTSESGCVGFDLDLDPYGPDLDSLRALAGDPVVLPSAADHSHGHGHSHDDHPHDHDHDHSHDEHDHSHDHGPLRDGWSTPVLVPLTSATALLGDPAGIPEADNTGGLLAVSWPAPGGTLIGTVYTRGGIRRALCVGWLAPTGN